MSIYNSFFPDIIKQPSFKKGIARILDINTELDSYNVGTDHNKIDSDALSHDWKTVGRDIIEAVKKYGKQSGNR